VNSFKYSVNTNYLKSLTCSEIAGLCKRLGMEGIEWGLPGLDDAASAVKEMVRVSRDHGLEVAAYINAAHLWKTDLMRQYSEIVASGGGTMLRVAHPWLAYSYDESLHQKASFMDCCKMAREGFERLVPLGREYGIRYVVETHGGGLFACPVTARFVMDGLDERYVGVIYDPANGVTEGFIRPRHAVEVLGPYLAYVHAKNLGIKRVGHHTDSGIKRGAWTHEPCSLDSGMIDYVELYFALKMVGYTGWVSFEEFYRDSPEPQLQKALAFVKQCESAAPSGPQEPYTTFND